MQTECKESRKKQAREIVDTMVRELTPFSYWDSCKRGLSSDDVRKSYVNRISGAYWNYFREQYRTISDTDKKISRVFDSVVSTANFTKQRTKEIKRRIFEQCKKHADEVYGTNYKKMDETLMSRFKRGTGERRMCEILMNRTGIDLSVIVGTKIPLAWFFSVSLYLMPELPELYPELQTQPPASLAVPSASRN
jgi:polyhydroxyalkanoate synthesis regulator phasin